MNTLEKILSEDPLKIRDDDHPERKDISKKEFQEALNLMKTKFKLEDKDKIEKTSEFSDGIIEVLNLHRFLFVLENF